MDIGWTLDPRKFHYTLIWLAFSPPPRPRRFPYKGTKPAITDLLGGHIRDDVRADSGRAVCEKCVLQLAGSMHGNAGILGFALENACA